MQNSAEPNHDQQKETQETRLAKARATADFEYHSPVRRKNMIIVASIFGTVLVLFSAIVLWTASHSDVLSAVPKNLDTLFQAAPSPHDPQITAARDGQTPFKVTEFAFPASDDPATLCVFSVFKAEKPDQSNANDDSSGTVEVNVSYDVKPIVLVVNGRLPITWKINVLKDTVKIQRVLAVGYHPQAVEGLDPSIPVEYSYYPYFNAKGHLRRKQTHVNKYTPFSFKFDTEKIEDAPAFKTMKKTLEKETGLHIATFTATYTTSAFELK